VVSGQLLEVLRDFCGKVVCFEQIVGWWWTRLNARAACRNELGRTFSVLGKLA
jgi:hypothetical protein